MKRAMQRAVLAGAIGATGVFTACELRPAPKPEPATSAKPTEPSGSGSGSGSENAAVAGSAAGSADAITGQAPGSGSAVTAGSGAGTGSAQTPPSAAGAGTGSAVARPVDTKLVESCGKVSEHVIGILIAAAPDASKPQLEKDRARIVGRMRDGCVTGNWTEEGRKCLSIATDQAGITACEPLLQPQGG